MDSHLRSLGNNRDVAVRDSPAVLTEESCGAAEQDPAVNAEELIGTVREKLADIAERGGAEHGVSERMEEDVAVRVRDEPLLIGDLHPSDGNRPVSAESMNVKPVPDSQHVLS